MNQKLKQAMDATRSGQKKEAQLLLTQVLQENPNETQAWYLLSMLVDAKSKKVSYLEKVITLNPSHQKAQEQLVHLNLMVTESEPEADLDQFAAQEEADNKDEEALPDWLKEPVQDNWIESEQPTLISEPTAAMTIVEGEEKPYQNNEPTTKETDKTSASISKKPTNIPTLPSNETKQKSPARLNFLLYFLIIGASITSLMFIYTLFTTYFSG